MYKTKGPTHPTSPSPKHVKATKALFSLPNWNRTNLKESLTHSAPKKHIH